LNRLKKRVHAKDCRRALPLPSTQDLSRASTSSQGQNKGAV